jgi:hypothetical protein
MLLRRIIDHLRRQEWTAIAIDFVIVVVGVFIGIQVANWNEARVNEARASGYLERIHNDLEANLTNYRDRMDFWAAVSDYGRKGLAYADTGRTGDMTKWDMLLAYFPASQVAEFLTTATTYEELKSAGELGLITNIDLRNALGAYYTNAGNPTLTTRPAYRENVRGVIPLDVQLFIWTNCYASNERAEQEFRSCASPISEQRAAEITNAIANDQLLMSELRYWMSTMHVASLIGRDRMTLAKQVKDSVAAELAKHS